MRKRHRFSTFDHSVSAFTLLHSQFNLQKYKTLPLRIFATLLTALASTGEDPGNSPMPDFTSFEDPNSIASNQLNEDSDFILPSGDADTPKTNPEEVALDTDSGNTLSVTDQTDWNEDVTASSEAGNPDLDCSTNTGSATKKLRKRGPSFCNTHSNPIKDGEPIPQIPPLPKINPAEQKKIAAGKQKEEEWERDHGWSYTWDEKEKRSALSADGSSRPLPLCCWGPGFGDSMCQANCFVGSPACKRLKRRFCCFGYHRNSDRSPTGDIGMDCVYMYPQAA